jgi:membrane-bound serine protease (ClpP class)
MRQNNLLTFIIPVLIGLLSSSLSAQDDTSKVYKVYQYNIDEEIAPPVWRKTKEAFQEANEIDADLILIHMNTYGGLLDAADSIRTKILKSEIPVYVFIDNNAASAGALISIACDRIYMVPGANIGAATVVDQTGKPLPDKYQSYMRSMMRSTAEASGRDPQIAQAMVDPKIYVEGISDTGQVLTFTASEALKHGFCEGIAESQKEVLKLAKIDNYVVVKQQFTAIDKIIHFLINPMVSGILIMMIMGGIYFELQTPGVGFPLAAAVLGALLYFAPLYLEGLAEHWEILLFLVGLILIALEIFVIPGFGVAGILGITLVVAGLTLSMVGNIGFNFSGVALTGVITSFFIVVSSMFFAFIISMYLGKKVLTTTTFGHIALDSTQQASKGFTSSDVSYRKMVGKTGVAKTILRPAGKVIIDGDVYDATAEVAYIDKEEKIKVTGYQTSQLIVTKV